MEQARLEREIIRVKGQPPTELPIWVTRHGPLFVTEGGDRMALRWAVAAAGHDRSTRILDIDRAQNWQQFTAALARLPGPGSNFVYADVDGNIGYHAAGQTAQAAAATTGRRPGGWLVGRFRLGRLHPLRPAALGLQPAGRDHRHRQSESFPADYPYPVNGNFAPPYRAHQIRELLSARDGLARGRPAGRADRRLLGIQPLPGGPDGGRVRQAQRRTIRRLDPAVALAARLERADGQGRWPRPF